MKSGERRPSLSPDICRPEVLGVEPYRPGKPLSVSEAEAARLVRLMSNENVLGPPPSALAAVADLENAHRYPDGAGATLKAALAARHNVSPECITLGNGSNEVLDLVARCFLRTGREAVFSRHAFAVYELVTRLSGGSARIAEPNAPDDAMPLGDNSETIKACVNDATAVVFIANPNNPTGTWLAGERLHDLLRALPPTVVVVIDQAYAEYADAPDYVDAAEWLAEFPNLVVTQTFSKIYGLAGLRVGYALSSPEAAEWFNRARQPFNVNVAAQCAATAALADASHVEKSREMNRAGLEQLRSACDELGLSHLPSAANFLCIHVGENMNAIYEHLFERGVIVRPIENYGMPEHLRVTVGRPEDNARFLDVLRDALGATA